MFNLINHKQADLISILGKRQYRKLKSVPRYTPTVTKIFNNELYANDACTLLADLQGILLDGVYEFESSSDKPIIIDCGSNIGISVIYFKKYFPNSLIYAFEPDPDLFTLLNKNIINFNLKGVIPEQKAIWINNSGISFKQEGGHSGTIVSNLKNEEDESTLITVSSVKLRSFLRKFDRIDMLKMDIEGAENEVILDCESDLKRCDHIFIEYHSPEDSSQKLHYLLALLSGLGFRYHIQEAFVRKRPFVDRDTMVGMDLQLNLYFYKNNNTCK